MTDDIVLSVLSLLVLDRGRVRVLSGCEKRRRLRVVGATTIGRFRALSENRWEKQVTVV